MKFFITKWFELGNCRGLVKKIKIPTWSNAAGEVHVHGCMFSETT